MLTLVVCYISAQHCPAGQFYFHERGIDECDSCMRGYYCPGDDKGYKCPQGSIAANSGATQCDKCPPDSPTSSITGTFCLPKDIPKDIRLMQASEIISLQEFDKSKPYLVQEFHFEKGVRGIMFNIADYHTGASVTLYASSKDKPSEKSFMWTGVGANVTVMIENPDFASGKESYLPVYFMVFPTDRQKVLTNILIHNIRYEPFVAKGPSTEITLPSTVRGYFFFSVPNVPVGSLLNVTVVTSGEKAEIRQSQYFSSKKDLQFPNENDYTQVNVFGELGRSIAITSIAVQKTAAGTQYFSVFPYCPYSRSNLTMKVLVNFK